MMWLTEPADHQRVIVIVMMGNRLFIPADLAGAALEFASGDRLVNQFVRPAFFRVRDLVPSFAGVSDVSPRAVLICLVLSILTLFAIGTLAVFGLCVVVEVLKRLCFPTFPARFHKKAPLLGGLAPKGRTF